LRGVRFHRTGRLKTVTADQRRTAPMLASR